MSTSVKSKKQQLSTSLAIDIDMDDPGGMGGIIYGLEYQCRALAAVEAESEKISFFVGTQSLKLNNINQIHCVTLDEESQSLSKIIFSHPVGEVWDLATSPKDPSVFVSRHSSIVQDGGTSCKVSATLWSTEKEDSGFELVDGGGINKLSSLCSIEGVQLENKTADVNHVSFMPGEGNKIMVLSENQLLLQDIDQNAKIVSNGKLEGKGLTSLRVGAWNPHQNCQTYAAVNDHVVRAWDIRTMEQVWRIDAPCQQAIRALDFNPNKQYYLATGGDDGAARFWDIRQPKRPLITREDHSHWIWSIKFNQFHDQLVLTSSSDCHVVLSCLASISSEPFGHILDEDEHDKEHKRQVILPDGLLKRFEDHEESVYVSAWSSADPWTIASLSYDGRLVINQVPRDIKFKILNLV